LAKENKLVQQISRHLPNRGGIMSPEKQRIVIAEFFGWNNIEDGLKIGIHPVRGWMPLPDYINDLNAIHEAIVKLPDDLRVEFLSKLDRITIPSLSKSSDVDIAFWRVNATAAQRAETFVRTICKWEDAS
jgi:hypothetical protein